MFWRLHLAPADLPADRVNRQEPDAQNWFHELRIIASGFESKSVLVLVCISRIFRLTGRGRRKFLSHVFSHSEVQLNPTV